MRKPVQIEVKRGRVARRWIVVLIAFVCLAVGGAESAKAGDPAAESDLEQAVEFLKDQTRDSQATFVRNGKSYPADEAVEHMQKKYEHFRKKGKIKTAEDFIRLAATKSLISGKPYTLKLPDGQTLKTADWLTEQLKRYRESSTGS